MLEMHRNATKPNLADKQIWVPPSLSRGRSLKFWDFSGVGAEPGRFLITSYI